MSQTTTPAEWQQPASRRRRPWWWLLGVIGLLIGLGVAAWLIMSPALQPVRSAEQLRQAAMAAAQQGQWDEATASLAELKQVAGLTADDQVLLAQVELNQSRYEAALAALRGLEGVSPEAAQARAIEGQVALRRQQLAIAEERFLEALKIDPELIPPRRELIFIYGMQLRRPEIQEQFRELARRTALSYDEVFLWNLSRGNNWEAKEHSGLLREFLKADPNDRWSRLALVGSLSDLSLLDESEKELEWFSKDDPDALAAQARVALKEGDPARIDELLAQGPQEHAELARMRGQVALSRRDAQAALRYYRLSDRLEPDQRETLFGLGRALQLAGDREAAAPYLEAARQLDALSTLVSRAAARSARGDLDLLRNLSKACEGLGRYPEAKAWLKLLIARDPLDREAQEALFQLEAKEREQSSPEKQK